MGAKHSHLPDIRMPAINFQAWIQENQHLLKPPVGNKEIFVDAGDFIVMVVGGPNRRLDYHDDPREEFFHQVKGNMFLELMTPDGPKQQWVREGDMFLLPAHVRHSPQRPEEGSIGIVVELKRQPEEIDGFEWYCGACGTLLHRVEVSLKDIVKDLPPLYDAFHNSTEKRTCPECGTLHPGK